MSPHICILMGTFNGARYVRQQLDSIAAQTVADWSLRVSDDGSTDATRDIVRDFAAEHPSRDIRLYDGPKQGSSVNFLSLLARNDLPPQAWVALSDQDDVWIPDRLEYAVQMMAARLGAAQHCVYASRTILTNADLTVLGPSRRHPKPPGFGNALVQNVLAGNTIVLDPAAAALLRRTAPVALEAGVPHHDWWIYLLLCGAGATVINDDRPGLYYRQHAENHLGANRGFAKGWARFSMLWDGRYADWLRRNLAALAGVSEALTPENRARAAAFEAWLAGSPRAGRAAGLRRSGVWRQSLAGNLMLHLAAAAGRL